MKTERGSATKRSAGMNAQPSIIARLQSRAHRSTVAFFAPHDSSDALDAVSQMLTRRVSWPVWLESCMAVVGVIARLGRCHWHALSAELPCDEVVVVRHFGASMMQEVVQLMNRGLGDAEHLPLGVGVLVREVSRALFLPRLCVPMAFLADSLVSTTSWLPVQVWGFTSGL